MILRSLELKHFGRFTERTFEFRRGMNLVLGPNESGKSTLMEAIPAILFGARDKERFRPWGRQGSCEAALVLEGGNRTLRIERDLLADRVTMAECDDLYQTLYQFEGKVSPQGRSSERAEYLQQLQRLFGVAEEEIFRASLFFGQGSLELSGQGLAAKMKALLSGFVEVDYDRVLESLQADYFTLTRENPWGKDKTRDRELDEIRRRIGQLEARWFAAQESLKELEALRARIAELQQGIEADRVEYAKGEKYLAWVRRQWHLEERQENLRKDFSRVNRQSERVSVLEQERQALAKDLAKTGLPREIPGDLPLLLAEAEEIRKELIALQGETALLRKQLLAQVNPPWKKWLTVTALLFAAAGLFGWLWPGLLATGLIGAGLFAAAIWGVYARGAVLARTERSRIRGQAQVLEGGREKAQARLAGLDERFESLGISPSAVEIVRMQKNLGRHREVADRLREVESALRELEKAEELTGEKEQLTREMAVLDERRERERPPRSGLLTPEELPEAEEKLAALGENLREREKTLLELARREAALQGELGNLQEIEEEGEQLKERELRLGRRKEAMSIAYDLLAGAVDEFRRTYLDRFAAETGHYLQMTTQGRYDSVRLGEDFTLSLKGRGGSWQPAEYFSRGTVDGIYLAVRLALARHLSRDRHLPLFLDDPLVNLDRHRLGETLRGLERLGAEHQVILFTHDEALARRAARDRWHVISLEEGRTPAVVRDAEKGEDGAQLCLL